MGAGVDIERPATTARRTVHVEILLVLGVSLGLAAVQAAVYLVGALTSTKPLDQNTAQLNGSFAPHRPLLDLALQLVSITGGVMPALLALHLLARDGLLGRLGFARDRVRADTAGGALLAAAIGIPGLLLYLASYALGTSAQVVAENLPAVWWRIPVLVLSAAQNALLEEVVVVGYLLTRLSGLGWRPWRAVAASATLRGSYHLYQGFGGFAGNLVMGVIFGRLYQRFGRVGPLVVAHTLLDTVAFVGYAVLHGHVSWLP